MVSSPVMSLGVLSQVGLDVGKALINSGKGQLGRVNAPVDVIEAITNVLLQMFEAVLQAVGSALHPAGYETNQRQDADELRANQRTEAAEELSIAHRILLARMSASLPCGPGGGRLASGSV